MIQDQYLEMPPEHSLAAEFYDLQIVQSTVLGEHYRASIAGEASRVAEMETALSLANDSIEFLKAHYRRERGADDSCTVGLTIGSGRFPLVAGRPTDGSPFIGCQIARPVFN
jgi:hypothetical protein